MADTDWKMGEIVGHSVPLPGWVLDELARGEEMATGEYDLHFLVIREEGRGPERALVVMRLDRFKELTGEG